MKDIKDIENKTRKFHDDADIYDAINDFDYDVKFWKKWCKKSGKSVLELCCGTGRIAIPMIKSGFDYAGIDISKPFIKAAKEKAKPLSEHYTFKLADIRKFNLQRKFHSIIIPFNAFVHLYHYKDAEKCFNCVKKHLYENGLFIVEMFNPDARFLVRDPNKRYLHDRLKTKTGLTFKHTENNKYDKATQINHVKWYYKFKGKNKEQVKHLHMRLYYPQEFEALLDYNGFRILNKFGCHKESKFNSDSVRQIIISKMK